MLNFPCVDYLRKYGYGFPKSLVPHNFWPSEFTGLTNHLVKNDFKKARSVVTCAYLHETANSCLGLLSGASFIWSGWPRCSASASSTYLQQNASKPLVSNGRKAGITHNKLLIHDLLWEVTWQCLTLDCHWAPELITWVNTPHEASLISLLSGFKLERDYFYWSWVSRLRW